ncbi:MAG: hypothetical protein U1E65_06635 [Myxococcota bacterium]
MADEAGLSAQEAEIRRSRGQTALSAVLWTVGGIQVAFWSFAIGTWLGPGPLGLSELTAGALFAIALGFSFSGFSVRHRIEDGALFVASAREGGKKKRVAVFPEYVTIDDEIWARGRLQGAELGGTELVVKVLDPALEGGVVERTFAGARPMLAHLRDELAGLSSPPPQPTP